MQARHLRYKMQARPESGYVWKAYKEKVTIHAFYPPVADFISPFQGLKYLFASLPRALPWVSLFGPFRANKEKNP